MDTFGLFLLFVFISQVFASEKLFYYGVPVHSTQSGFIKIDPQTNAWEIAADGFTTLLQDGYADKGLAIPSSDRSPLMYGQFNIWNETYVGCILKLDEENLSPSIFNSGVLGQSISSLIYFNNDTEVAMLGYFVGLQQNPNLVVNHVAACSADGKSCYPLGNGLPDYFGDGVLKSIGQSLYAKYTTDLVKVAVFDQSSQNQTWSVIYEISREEFLPKQMSVEVYEGSLWMFGFIVTPDNQTVSAARWNSSEFSWEYMYSSSDPRIMLPESVQVQTAVSPNGDTVYLMNYINGISTVFVWNNQIGNWNLLFNMSCDNRPVIAALDGGLVATCNDSVISIPQGNFLPNLTCGAYWNSLAVSSDNSKLYAVCTYSNSQDAITYDLTQQTTTSTTTMSGFESLTYVVESMCLYGSKMMITGQFQRVGGVSSPVIAIWDSAYKRWYRVTEEQVSYCTCGSDGVQVAAFCLKSFFVADVTPILILDTATSDSGNQEFIQNIELYNVTDLVNVGGGLLQVKIYNNSVFIGASAETNMTLFQWTSQEGAKPILSMVQLFFLFDIVDNVVFLSGNAAYGTTNTARFNLTNNMWLPMDQLSYTYNNQPRSTQTWAVQYWDYTGDVYLGGEFTAAGSSRVSNVVGYNSLGSVSDTVAGGVTDPVTNLQPLGDRLYLITSKDDCFDVDEPGCGNLVYYSFDTKTYSVVIATGVAMMASGEDSPPDHGGSSSDESSEGIWKIIIVVIAVVFTGAVLAVTAALFYKRFGGKRSNYQEIPDMQPSVPSSKAMDFQHEEFVMKSALGKGAYGTVWSCVFPHREGAVKQMLFSKGDTKRIETVLQEIDILEKFRHPHIVHYCGHRIEATQTSVECFIFMELYEQPCSLKGVIQKKMKMASQGNSGKNAWFTYEEIKSYLIQIADGLNYLHSNGIAHRDLKCANILVRLKGGLVTSLHIADFGISKVMSHEGVNVLASTVLGTPAFMAPEILTNQKYDALKADMWSFGMMMYEMLSWQENGTPGKKPQFPEEVTEFMNQDPRFEGLLEIYNKCTQQEPNSRPTVSELLFLCESLS